MAATITVDIAGWLWIHDADDLTDYLAIPWSDGTRDPSVDGRFDALGDGSTVWSPGLAGVRRVRTYDLPDVPGDVLDNLDARVGITQLVRDWRSAYHGVFAAAPVRLASPTIITAQLTIIEVAAPAQAATA